jgi:hypothetical protein
MLNPDAFFYLDFSRNSQRTCDGSRSTVLEVTLDGMPLLDMLSDKSF